MGHSVSLPADRIFGIAHLDECLKTFTVKRKSGIAENGWIFIQGEHEVGVGPVAGRDKPGEPFRVLMTNGKSGKDLVSGWRRIETIFPDGLAEPEIAEWQDKFRICLSENFHQLLLKSIATASDDEQRKALKKEYDDEVDAEVEADLKLRAEGRSAPFRSPHYVKYEDYIKAMREAALCKRAEYTEPMN